MINTHWGGVVEDNSFSATSILSSSASWGVTLM